MARPAELALARQSGARFLQRTTPRDSGNAADHASRTLQTNTTAGSGAETARGHAGSCLGQQV
jgi:hypothetical protein